MERYAKNIEDRKNLVKRLEELTGLKAKYTRLPRLAFDIGSFSVEKEGTLLAEDGADAEIIRTLQAEGLIGPELRDEAEEAQAEALADAYVPVSNPEPETSLHRIEDWDPTEANDQATVTGETWQEPETYELPEPAAEDDSEETEDGAEAADAEEGTGYPMDLTVAIPLAKHTPTSLANLVSMVYSRGPLLSKATGGAFGADKELVDAMLTAGTFVRTEDLVKFLTEKLEAGSRLDGMRFEGKNVVFDGFKEVPDAEHAQVFTRLAARMSKMALTQKRVQAKTVSEENEKYSLRIWLVRLGMNGDDCKVDRKILMEHLSGHAAFRTDAEKEKWMARQAAKKAALKAQKAADAEEQNTDLEGAAV